MSTRPLRSLVVDAARSHSAPLTSSFSARALVYRSGTTSCARCLNRYHSRTQRRYYGEVTAGRRRVTRCDMHRPLRGVRGLATAVEGVVEPTTGTTGTAEYGPLKEYENRVALGRLRDDDHQRDIIQRLQVLHETLRGYTPPTVIKPSLESLNTAPKSSFFDKLFSRAPKPADTTEIPADLPKGLYMHGDVGCGKTMLMDLFYDTLPPNITSKTRIHFHNFMQGVHKRLHVVKMQHGADLDGVPFVAADIAKESSVLCFDEFQCTDVADAMILRRLLESLMSHGVILVTTSNRHPDELYKNGIQRESFIPCIQLLKTALTVLNLDSTTDYRKIPRPPSGVYHHPLGAPANHHADKWFQYLGDFKNDPPHRAVHQVWGRDVVVPRASGKAARFTFDELIGRATGAADYLELMNSYNSFIITDVPGMSIQQRDLARRFITFIDAVYESRAKLVLTSAVPLNNIFLTPGELEQSSSSKPTTNSESASDSEDQLPDDMRKLMDDLGLSMSQLKTSSIFSGDEERFAFARALSRLTEMESKEWVESGLGMGMSEQEAKGDKAAWDKTRSRWAEDTKLLPITDLVEEERTPHFKPQHFYPIRLDEILNNRYQIDAKIGWRTSPTVWLARDLYHLVSLCRRGWRWLPPRYVAIKVKASNYESQESAEKELRITEHITNANPEHLGHNFVATLLDSFRVTSPGGTHICMVFDALCEPLWMLKRRFKGNTIPLDVLKAVSLVILQGLRYLHTECHVIHTGN